MFNDIEIATEATKLFIALIIGAIIGAEREYKSKAAGFRTVILITVGSTIFTIVSNVIGMDGRIASNIVTGIGFLGAGSIFREGTIIKGITTATTIWISAAIGMAVGIGKYEFAFLSLFVVMLVLLSFNWIQRLIDKTNKVETYTITLNNQKINSNDSLKDFIKSHNLIVKTIKQNINQDKQTFVFSVQGSEINHNKLIESLFETDYIVSFEI
ncbi:MAG: MgtC/SapB family protein [Crocinitomicaceae bacterium]|jgi:putative Mg2+ transporter-C (MgtC) family protein